MPGMPECKYCSAPLVRGVFCDGRCRRKHIREEHRFRDRLRFDQGHSVWSTSPAEAEPGPYEIELAGYEKYRRIIPARRVDPISGQGRGGVRSLHLLKAAA